MNSGQLRLAPGGKNPARVSARYARNHAVPGWLARAASRPMLGRMSVKLIVGPPNSGRTGKMLDGFRAAAGRDPVLVVPTVDDVERFEGELTRDGEAVIGATVGTFDQLFALVARATDAPAGPALSPTQRLRLAREAARAGRAEAPRDVVAAARLPGGARGARLRAAGRARRPGLAARARGGGGAVRARDRRAVRVLRRGSRRARPARRSLPRRRRDRRAPRATRRLGSAPRLPLRLRRPDGRAARAGPRALGEHRGDGRPALGGPRVADRGARGPVRGASRTSTESTIERLEPSPASRRARPCSSSSAASASRRRGEPIENDGGVALLASAGELAEVEAVGAEVARLLDDGVPAGEIAIVLRDPRSAGPLYRRVLPRFDIPVAVQADLAATRTVTGAGLIALLRAAVGARRRLGPARLPAHAGRRLTIEGGLVRAEGAARPDADDRRGARGLAAGGREWRPAAARGRRSCGRPGSGAALLREAGKQARWIAESAVRREGAVAEEDRALELRAGAEIERALAELAELGLPHSPSRRDRRGRRARRADVARARPRAGCG